MRLELIPSRLELIILATCHILVAYTIWQAGWSVPVSLCLTLLTGVHACYQLFRCLLLLDRSILCLQLGNQGRLKLTTRREQVAAEVSGVPFFSSQIILLDCKPCREHAPKRPSLWPGKTTYRVLIAADACPAKTRKQLACLLLHGDW